MTYYQKSQKPTSTSQIFPLCQNNLFTDTISSIDGFQYNNAYCFGCTSWDKSLRAFFVQNPQSITLAAEQHIPEPITSLCVVAQMFVIGTAGGNLGLWDLQKNQITPLHQFTDAVVSIKYIESVQSLVVASLDGSLGLYDIRAGRMNLMNIGGKIVQMDAKDELIAYSTPGKLEIFNLATQKNESAMRLSTTSNVNNSVQSIAFFPDKQGVIFGSVDGRVNVVTFGTKDNKKTYAFKAQHKKITQTQSTYFPVNALSFYNESVFLTGGSDGIIHVWDKNKKSLINDLQSPIANCAITSAKFICNGSFLAFAVGNDYHKGCVSGVGNVENVPVIKIVDEPLVKS